MWLNLLSPRLGSWRLRGASGVVYSCYLTPHHVHAAHAVTGAICVACCASVRATVARAVSRLSEERVTQSTSDVVETVRIEHPSGAIDVRLEAKGGGAELTVRRAGIVLTARTLMDGQVFVSEILWPQPCA